LKSDSFRISEISEEGSVPNLACQNETDKYVLILQGEEITGAKQNRILNVSVIVPPNSSVILPVSCVEQGRWRYRRQDFTKGYHAYTDLKRKLMEDVAESASMGRGYEANQSRVWRDIDEKQDYFNKYSRTGAMHELYEDIEPEFERFINKLDIDFAAGICVYINGHVVGIDVFPSQAFFKNAYRDILRSYFLESTRFQNSSEPCSTFKEASSFLKYLNLIPSKISEGVSMGNNINIISNHAVGSLLIHKDMLVHFTSYPRF